MRCDFCNESATWTYPARDVVVMDLPVRQGSLGAWAACDQCSRLIEAEDDEGLARRSLAGLQPVLAVDSVQLLATLRGIHLAFWEAREGERQALA